MQDIVNPRGGGWGIRVILERVCEPVFQNLPHSYTWPSKKTYPFIYLIIQNVNLFIYCPLIFCTHFFSGYYTNITVNSYNTKRISSLEKSLSEKYVHIPRCQKNGAFHIGIQKNRAIHIHVLFVEKRGPIIYLAALKKGAIRHAHPYYAIYRKLPPTPTPSVNPYIFAYARRHFFAWYDPCILSWRDHQAISRR